MKKVLPDLGSIQSIMGDLEAGKYSPNQFMICGHDNSASFCKACFQEVHSGWLGLQREQADKITKILNLQQHHVHSSEFLRET